MKNYKQTASDVLRLVGGEKNVVQVEHCSTRLRFTLADTSKVDAAALKKTAGVMGVISSGPQCQVVIGNDVIEVYDELLKLGTFNAGQAAAPAAPKGKKEIGGIILDYMVGIFQPLVPAIAGAGVLKALMVLLSTLGLMSSGDIAYKVFVGVADAALYYLPVMVAFTTATKFNCNKLVAVALAAAMIHPSVSALLATEGGAYFLGIKLQNIAYGGQVFPAILTVIFMSFIEKWANKWCPKAIALEEVKDEVFSQKILGDGIAVVPEKGELYAPADGVIESVFGTKHAISMKTAAGAELLMHIGMDTVKRDGKGFDPQVMDGETVKKGQLLMKFDLDGIKADGYDVTTPIVVTNADEFTIKTVAEGAVVPGAALLKLEANK